MFASKDSLLTRPSGYNIARSVRLRSSASGYFNRTFSGSPTTFTMSMWLKRGSLSSQQLLACARYSANSSASFIDFNSSDQLHVILSDNTSFVQVTTTAVFRDPSAWYHVIVASTAGGTCFVYVNNSQVASMSVPSGYWLFNNAANVVNTISRYGDSSLLYFDGYLTEINFIDGQALTPSSFGETDSITGVWKPKAYSGTYGTNGFELNFSDNSNNTATTIGKDYSGNGNNWTPNNISVTSGVTYDSMVDSPTVGSLSSNYCVLNPLNGSQGTLSNGNLTYASTGDGTGLQTRLATFGVTSGKWYFEATVTTTSDSIFGIVNSSFAIASENSDGSSNAWINKRASGGTSLAANGGSSSTIFTGDANGDIVQIAFDVTAGKFWIGRNGTWAASGDPASGTNAQFTNLTSGSTFYPMVRGAGGSGATSTLNANFGQRPFTYTPPTGFVALNTYNLPASTITNGAAYMAATTYTGTGSARSVTGVGFQPDFVWIKERSSTSGHALFDVVRGVQKRLVSNTTDAEDTSAQLLTAFNSDGFSVGTDGAINENTQTYVGWQWKAGGTSASNTNGSITSTVSAGATQGFSVVTYTGTGANATVGHGLGVAPSFIIARRRNDSVNWYCYHASLSAGNIILLNSTNAQVSVPTAFNSGTPTSTTFPVGGDTTTNASGGLQLAYCFSAVAGYSAFGSYTGNASADGTFVYLGFRPRFVLMKYTAAGGDWYMYDSTRSPINVSTAALVSNSSAAEISQGGIDFLSNGFKLRASNNPNVAATYIYMAFAESPFKTSLAR